MMVTRKTRLIVLGLIALVLLLLIVWLFLFLRRPSATPASSEPVLTEDQKHIPEISQPTLKDEELKKEQQTREVSVGATTLAKLFAERYGSYSNEAHFQNLFDVMPLMTESFAQKTKAFVASTTLPDTYYGVSTRVLTVKVEALDDAAGTATISMQTQREVAQGSTQNVNVMYQEIRLSLVKQAGVWKVDSADWQ
ncbi:hypothetical protein HZA85_00570 [Candidatus Uhrbacteria bacterium]|nr:hypothetical protein [Candidatus Uhrbacteria bacterium]